MEARRIHSGKFRNTIIGLDSSLRDAMASLNNNAQGVVFVLSDTNKVKGLLTDGDIRRSLLDQGDLNDSVERHMNKNFISGSTLSTRENNLALLNEKIRNLPILDDEGRLVEVLFWSDFFRLPVMEPELKGNELSYVSECITTNWISSQGKYVTKFQDTFAEFIDIDYALCVSNGTSALHLALAALGVGENDEVIVPDLTFISPASMSILCGARPVFVDVDRHTWTMDPNELEGKINERTRAIIPVHLYGHPCDMDPIMSIAKKYGLHVIEDCAEALGAEYKGKKVGTFGDIGTFSFFANKVITTGEGGMCCTRNADLNEKMRFMRDHGMSPNRRYWHDVVGYNYRLTNVQAAIGLAQIERIDEFLSNRKIIVKKYNERLCQLDGITLPPQREWAKNIFWLYSVLIDEHITGISRDKMIKTLSSHGVDSRPFFHPLHEQPPFEYANNQTFPITKWLASNGISLPTSNNISLESVEKVCDIIGKTLESSTVFKPYN